MNDNILNDGVNIDIDITSPIVETVTVPNYETIQNHADEEEEEKNLFLFGRDMNIKRSQLITIVLLSLYFFLSSCYYSLFAPFFPSEALKKGITQTHVGIIFGILQFVILVLSTFFGKYMQVFGIRFLFVGGLFISSGSEILFGFLDMCPDGFIFFIMCVACRTVTGIGSSMGLSYAIVGHYFPNKISSIVAMLEVFNGFGLMVGPVVGGFLFELGGFRLPFFSMGGLLFFLFIIAFWFFPDAKQNNSFDRQTLPMLPLLKIPRFFLTLQMLFVGSLSIGFIEPSIQIHLLPLNLSPVQIGSILLFPSLLYIITTPIVGHFCDKHKGATTWFMFFSAIISAASFSFFGPIPWYNLPLKLWIFLSGFIVFGLSIGGLTIPVYSELTNIAIDHGYPNDLRTQGLISGFFSSVWSLGALVGPVVGGYVVDKIGFDLASFGIVIFFSFTGLLYAIFNIGRYCKKANNRQTLILEVEDDDDLLESDPLLNA